MKPETAKKFIELTDAGRRVSVKDVPEGTEISWDFEDDEMTQLMELEHPGITEDQVEEKFGEFVKELVHEAIKHAKKVVAANSNPESGE